MRTLAKVAIIFGILVGIILVVFVSALDREITYIIWLGDLGRAADVEEVNRILGRILSLGLHPYESDLAFERANQRVAELEAQQEP